MCWWNEGVVQSEIKRARERGWINFGLKTTINWFPAVAGKGIASAAVPIFFDLGHKTKTTTRKTKTMALFYSHHHHYYCNTNSNGNKNDVNLTSRTSVE